MRRRSIRIALVLVVVLVAAAVATVVTVSRVAAVDAAFTAFWMAQSPVEAADVISEIWIVAADGTVITKTSNIAVSYGDVIWLKSN